MLFFNIQSNVQSDGVDSLKVKLYIDGGNTREKKKDRQDHEQRNKQYQVTILVSAQMYTQTWKKPSALVSHCPENTSNGEEIATGVASEEASGGQLPSSFWHLYTKEGVSRAQHNKETRTIIDRPVGVCFGKGGKIHLKSHSPSIYMDTLVLFSYNSLEVDRVPRVCHELS